MFLVVEEEAQDKSRLDFVLPPNPVPIPIPFPFVVGVGGVYAGGASGFEYEYKEKYELDPVIPPPSAFDGGE